MDRNSLRRCHDSYKPETITTAKYKVLNYSTEFLFIRTFRVQTHIREIEANLYFSIWTLSTVRHNREATKNDQQRLKKLRGMENLAIFQGKAKKRKGIDREQRELGKRTKQVGKRTIGLFMMVRGGLPGMLGPCKADLTKRRIRARPRARARGPALARSLWARNIETQDVLLCHPRAGDLLVMNIVAHGGTWPARPRGVLPKYVRRLAYWTSFPPLHAAIFIPKCHVNHRRTLEPVFQGCV